MRLFILSLSLTILLASCAHKITHIALEHDRTVSLPMSDHLSIGATLTYSNGKEKKTKSLLQGKKSWKGLVVDTKGGSFKNGLLLINYAEAVQNDFKVSISCKQKRRPETISAYVIPIPQMRSLKIKVLNDTIAPGTPTPLKFEMVFDNGKSLRTNSGSNFKFLKDLQISYLGIEHTANDPLYIPRRPTRYDDSIEVRCYYKTVHSLTGIGHLPVHYKASYLLSISGTTGAKGNSGQDGNDDINGQNGQQGGRGDHGGSMPPLHVWITPIDTVAHLASIVTNIDTHVEYYIIDYSSTAQLAISAKGGEGGDGGKGGRGGDGSDETDKRAPGKGGEGGAGGNGGNGGNGADVNIFVETGFQHLATQLLLIDQSAGTGGTGGNGGKGGTNGKKLKTSKGGQLLRLLGTERANSGRQGENGSQGHKGNTKIVPLDHEAIMQGIGRLTGN